MNIKFNQDEKTLEIKDGLKLQHFAMKMTLVFTLINSVLYPLAVLDGQQLRWMGFIWVILGLISMGGLIHFLWRKSASEKLQLDDICSLEEKQFLGRKRFSLKLRNGKWRDLMEVKKEAEIRELKTLFESIGIKTS